MDVHFTHRDAGLILHLTRSQSLHHQCPADGASCCAARRGDVTRPGPPGCAAPDSLLLLSIREVAAAPDAGSADAYRPRVPLRLLLDRSCGQRIHRSEWGIRAAEHELFATGGLFATRGLPVLDYEQQ